MSRSPLATASSSPPAPAQADDSARRWMRQYGRLVRSIARRTVRDDTELEEVVQEVFVKLWRAMDRFDPTRAKESTFVAVVAQRCVVDFHRRRTRLLRNRPDPLEEVAEPAVRDEDRAERHEEFARAARVLETMSADRERILGMSYLDGITHREIARRTGLSLGTVKSHLRRGLKKLRERLHLLPCAGPA